MGETLIVIGTIAFLCKIICHGYLDYRSNRKENLKILFLGGFTPLEYFLHYFENVDKEMLFLKKICNIFYFTSLISLILYLFYRWFTSEL